MSGHADKGLRPVSRMEFADVLNVNDRIGDDLLSGARPIAAELGWTERAVYNAHARGNLPTFRIGHMLCARRSSLREHITRLESGSLAKAS